VAEAKSALVTVAITIDAASVACGHEKMNERAGSAAIFDVQKYPMTTYQSRLVKFRGDVPTAVEGVFTLHGISKPLRLAIRTLKCPPDRLTQTLSRCGDAISRLNRADFGTWLPFSIGEDRKVEARWRRCRVTGFIYRRKLRHFSG
jgi:polyisoprenoid-binding protein YceI